MLPSTYPLSGIILSRDGEASLNQGLLIWSSIPNTGHVFGITTSLTFIVNGTPLTLARSLARRHIKYSGLVSLILL